MKFKSAVKTLQEFISIIMALALANASAYVLTRSVFGARAELAEDPNRWPLFIAFLFTLIRFYHGNLRHLDDWYIDTTCKDTSQSMLGDPRGQGIFPLEFFCILFQALLFGTISFFQGTELTFLLLLGAILFIDIIMFCPAFVLLTKKIMRTASTEELKKLIKEAGHRLSWVTINVIIILILVIVFVVPPSASQVRLWVTCMAFVLGCIADYILNRKFFFPSPDQSN